MPFSQVLFSQQNKTNILKRPYINIFFKFSFFFGKDSKWEFYPAKMLLILLLSIFPVVTWACCMIPQPPVENYREKVGLPFPNSKTSDSTIYPNLPRYGINCGHNMYWNVGDSGLIVGGVEAYENELPYQVLIGYGILYCGGAILNQLSSQF